MANGYVAVPPDSTGKRVATTPISLVPYTNGTSGLLPGLTITGATSGATGTVSSITKDASGTSGEIYIKNLSAAIVQGEQLQINNVNVATAAGPSIDLHMQVVNIGDAKNPDLTARISGTGAIKTISDNYAIQYDSYGAANSIGRTPIFIISKDTWNKLLTQQVSANSSITPATHGEALTLTTGTAATDYAKVSSVIPIHTNMFSGREASIYIDSLSEDSGKAGVVRRFGIYSDADGAFFQLNGTNLELGIKSSISGTVQETIYSVVDWNAGNPTTSLLAQYGPPTIDVTKINRFFMTISHSHVIWGVVTSSHEHQIVHMIDVSNTSALPLFKSEGWRFVMEQYNTTAQALASSCQLISAYAFAKGIEYEDMSLHQSSDFGTIATPIAVANTETGVAALRIGTLPNDIHKILLLEKIRALVTGGDIILKVYKGVSITGATWTQVPNSAAEYTTGFGAGVTVTTTNAELINTFFVQQNSPFQLDDEPDQTNMFVSAITKDIAGGDYNIIYITAQALAPATTANLHLTLGWDELV